MRFFLVCVCGAFCVWRLVFLSCCLVFVVWCLSFGVLVFGVCCSLLAVCLFVCRLICRACCLFFVVCGLRHVVGCCLLFVVRGRVGVCLGVVDWRVLFVCRSYVVCCLTVATCCCFVVLLLCVA